MPRRLRLVSGAEVVPIEVEVGLRWRPGGFQDWGITRKPHSVQVGLDGGGIGDRRDDAHAAPAVATCFEVEFECAGQQGSPKDPILALAAGLLKLVLVGFSWDDLVAILGVWREDAVITNQVCSRRRDQRGELLDS